MLISDPHRPLTINHQPLTIQKERPPVPTVLITSTLLWQSGGPHLDLLRGAGCEVRYPPERGTPDEAAMRGLIPGVDAVLASPEPYTESVLACADRLKIIAHTGVGYERLDLEAAMRRAIVH